MATTTKPPPLAAGRWEETFADWPLRADEAALR